MKNLFLTTVILFGFNSFALSIGEEAPDFSLKGSPTDISLKSLKGKVVVLEWYNEGCPYVRKHYDAKNMQALQKKYKDKVTWLTINSSAKGKQGFIKDISEATSTYKREGMSSASLLRDEGGSIGMKYRAKTTPHMYIIGKEGKLLYQGAIDSTPSANQDDIKKSKNYVSMALGQVLAGDPVKLAKTRAYGCSVKY